MLFGLWAGNGTPVPAGVYSSKACTLEGKESTKAVQNSLLSMVRRTRLKAF